MEPENKSLEKEIRDSFIKKTSFSGSIRQIFGGGKLLGKPAVQFTTSEAPSNSSWTSIFNNKSAAKRGSWTQAAA